MTFTDYLSDTYGIPIIKTNALPQGQFMIVGKPPQQLIAGSRPFTDVELTIRRIVAEVFGVDWLKQIGAWQYSTGEILEMMRGRRD